MVAEIISAIAVTGALTGAALNSIRAWREAPESETFSWKKFGGGLLASMIPALLTVNFVNLEGQAANGLIALFIGQLLAGVGTSTLMAKAHGESKQESQESSVTQVIPA